MRGAAVLAVIASSMVRYIFQPTYLLESGEELSEIMTNLAGADLARESHLRSVLLAVLPAIPEWQKEVVPRRISHVVTEVMKCVGPLLSPEKGVAFKKALQALCEQACERWMRLQRCDAKVLASLERPYDEVEYWKLLPLQSSTANGSASSPRPSGTNTTSSGSSRSSTPVQGRAGPGSLEYKDIVGVVWPSFFVVQQGDLEPLKTGFVLGGAQVKAAREEESNASTMGPRRGPRQNTRRSRQLSIPMINGIGSLDRHFLSSGVGVGPSGG